MSISTHVLDATTGRPAAGLELVLSQQDGGRLARAEPGGAPTTDGRVSDLAAGAGRPSPTRRGRVSTGSSS